MARLARVVIPSLPHHVIQRGVRSLPIFFSDADREAYLALLAQFGAREGLQFWAWCLMTNHVHLVVVPPDEPTALARAIGEAHRRYTRLVNFRERVRGHLFQERFHSFPIQTDPHLLTVVRYVERNPVRARMVPQAVTYPWSSARHHVQQTPDRLVTNSPIHAIAPDWGRLLLAEDDDQLEALRRHVRTGRPWGSDAWVRTLEQQVGRVLRPRLGGWPKGRSRLAHIEH
jgi:putative transposase